MQKIFEMPQQHLIDPAVFYILFIEVYPPLFLRMDDEITAIIETLAIVNSSPQLHSLRQLLNNRRSVSEWDTRNKVLFIQALM